MIYRNDISTYFNSEADAAKKSWESLMDFPVKERIRKRKTIEGVILDKSSGHERTEENKIKLKISFEKNLSDFKEGDALILHDGSPTIGIKCSLYAILDDNNIELEVYPPNMYIETYNSFLDKSLFLDKDYVDLREHVYYNFLAELPHDSKFWQSLIINNSHCPTYEDKAKCEEELDDTCKNFELNLLSRQREAILNSMAAKDYYLIQGPPGTGKSYVLSIIIIEEIAFFKHKVIVIGPNHMAVNNTLEQVLKLAPTCAPFLLKVGQLYHAPKKQVSYEEKDYNIRNLINIDVPHTMNLEFPWAIGMTPHSLYTSRAGNLECDTLVIDEAGQMTIPLALMGMIKAKKVILAGDHKQLPPIITSDEISDELKASAFQALMKEDNCTMLDVSFRMCEPICNFVSELFYDGKLKPYKAGCGNLITDSDPLYDFHSPIVFHDVNDEGEQISDLEADYIAEIISQFLKRGLSANEIAVLSPFRAQAANVKRHIRRHLGINDEQKNLIVSDTVDKMQGQEREVIIYSFTAGDLDYMNEMADFLYNPNKMNVAFSRAKSKLIVVANTQHLKEIPEEEYPHVNKMLKSKYVTFV